VKNFLFSASSRLTLGSTQLGALSPGVKRPGREGDDSPAASAEVKKIWIYTSIPPYTFMLNKLTTGTNLPFFSVLVYRIPDDGQNPEN
jgi:hypothetical protein